MLKLFLFEILCRRNTFDNIADLIQGMHDHDRTRRLEHTALHQRNLDMEDIHAGLFGLLHDIDINIIDSQIG